MLVQRRAVHKIQAQLKEISQKCNLEYAWTNHCIQFFSNNEGTIKYVSPSYEIFSAGLLFYIIRKSGIPITLDYFSIKVLQKIKVSRKKVHSVYRKLCDQFGDPQTVNFKTIVNTTINYLNKSNLEFRLLEMNPFESEFIHPMKSKEFSSWLYSYQSKPVLFKKDRVYELILDAFENMKLI